MYHALKKHNKGASWYNYKYRYEARFSCRLDSAAKFTDDHFETNQVRKSKTRNTRLY
jgi:hypothetical protein